ncbi:hypothetical protein VNO78_08116 [Psophocarpus tetragonolobus]|uniref:Uncharacterized protein n=1 Tax=Psophocarpus tetragonolobus TaxID=3891 RepID=A0AAN9SU82_PSOTE
MVPSVGSQSMSLMYSNSLLNVSLTDHGDIHVEDTNDIVTNSLANNHPLEIEAISFSSAGWNPKPASAISPLMLMSSMSICLLGR